MNQENYTEAMINAETAFSNENYALALEWFRKALEENPNDLRALSRAGTVCVPLDKFDESFEYFKKAMELNPENGDNAFNLGNAYFFHGDYGKALDLYAEAEMKGCSDEAKPKLYYQMALLCSVRQDVKSALANFEKYEASDKTGTAALNPDVISEKVKLYMMAEDYENAAKFAVQWITVSPAEIRGYMVYFSLLMAKGNHNTAEQVLNDAEKYAELDEENAFTLKLERITLLLVKADADAANAAAHLKSAYDLATVLCENAPIAKKKELALIKAEICMKMSNFTEAITIASALIPNESAHKYDIEHHDVRYEELDETEIEAMAAEDMQIIEEKIAAGEIDENIGECAESYYDEEGNIVREYPEGLFDEETSEVPQSADEKIPSAEEVKDETKADYYDRLYYVLLSCYASIEDYENVYKFSSLLKFSDNMYYSYFGRYTEAFSMKKLSEISSQISKEAAEEKYAETIAFFRSKMLQSSGNNFAVVFRARMYAESAKFAKAEEMASLLTLDEKKAVMAYIEECRKELQNM